MSIRLMVPHLQPYDKPPVVVADFLPPDVWHGSKYLSFGPDNKLYFGIGARRENCGCLRGGWAPQA